MTTSALFGRHGFFVRRRISWARAASIDVLSLPGQKAQITQQNIACGVVKSDLPKTVINTWFVYPSGTP